MVKISFAPIKELVVHEAVNVPYDDLLRERVMPQGTIPLCWCNGILFSFTSMPMSKDVTKDYMNGIIHWMEVHYSEMKTYKPIVELNDEEYKATMKIRVIDTSKSELHTEFIKWLKSSGK
jgi:hypothetical protein